MCNSNEPSLRIDWFDCTIIEEPRQNSSQLTDVSSEEASETAEGPKPRHAEKKLMGFKRLLDLSQLEASTITLQISGRSSFWDLFETELKNDYIVLIATIIAKLCISLRSDQKSLMLTKLLNKRFLPSRFINILSSYLQDLPGTKTVEKRMNMLFWDDAESFYWKVLDICEGICVLNHEEAEMKVMTLLKSVQASVYGLMEEHRERFPDTLINKISDIHVELLGLQYKSLQMKETNPNPESQKESFHNLNIFPTKEDILGTYLCAIEPNIINGAYASVEHYLDVQFKLLREDCFGPLREGISKYMENPMKRQHENIRVHPKVRIVRNYVSNNKVGYLVDIAWSERQNQCSVDNRMVTFTKQLMFGSLLLFTSDNFETILCATVLDSNSNLLSEGYIAVSFHGPISSSIYSVAYLMVESEVFFEPYHRVLKILQNSSGNDIPMSRYIVNVQHETCTPSYLSSETMYNLFIRQTNTEVSFPVLQIHNWPDSTYFELDESQMAAYKLALTREFAVIQGPPGTGKTFIGIKVARTILENLSLEGTPMLVICYTNHVLDQFLEALLNVTNNIIRLGSQSKNKAIEPFNLNNLRAKVKSKYSYLYNNKRIEQEKLFKDMMVIQDDIEKCEKEILNYETIKPFLEIDSKTYELNKSYDEDPILKWLFDVEGKHVEKNSDDVLDDWEQEFEDSNEKTTKETTKVESCFSEKWVLKEIDSIENSIKYIKDMTDNQHEEEKMVGKFRNQIDKLRWRLDSFMNNVQQYQNSSKKFKEVPEDLYNMQLEDGWILYFKAVNNVKDKLMNDMELIQVKHGHCSDELQEIATLVDAEVVKTARVVGVTTTGAARRHDLLQALKSPIVIIEEAAEVLEAHIVASLTHHCKHVILIGDHKQLRPTAAHYKLAKDYNLEISLFERMIRNGVHACALTLQRRMRPIFVDLIVPSMYERLDSHPKVFGYPDVRGMKKTLFFLTHNIWEDRVINDSWSHKHTTEARWCVALANYLRQNQYTARDVTILATYAGQVTLIKEMSKHYAMLCDCKITVVDNYQGEESKIVILSLVRSNREGKIGFLAAQNRICVALSRAKEGFYMFGNMDVLKTASPIWRAINSKLLSHNAIGNNLVLSCSVHPENTMTIQKLEDFENCSRGQCLKICGCE